MIHEGSEMKETKSKSMSYWVVLVIVIATLVIAGCSAAAPQSSFDNSAPAATGGMAAEAPQEDAVAQAGDGAASANRRIIARAALTLVVADTQATVDSIGTLMDELGGYVSTSNLYRSTWNNTDALQGSITLRVPSENLEAALDALAGMAVEVDSRTLNREDVTDQYTDVDAQIRNLEATEQELLAMLEEVRERPNSTTEDIMSVYRTLTEVRGQIETLQGRKNMWDNLIALSTIDVTLVPDSANLPVAEEGWRPTAVLREAQRALVGGLQGVGNLIIWIVVFFLPMMLLLLLPLIVLFFILRWFVRRFSKPKPPVATAPPPAAVQPPAPSA
jgi:flagellar basal body-associated protein FliL